MASDDRTYIRLHDGMPDHPKVVGLSDAAFRLYIEALCYCSRHLTDGVIPVAAMRRMGTTKAVREVAAAGLIEAGGDDWRVHDYLQHQRSAAEVDELKQKRRAAGKKGGQARASAQASAKQVLEQTGSKAQPETETETEDASSEASWRRKRASRIPDDFTITPEMASWATERGFARRWVESQTERFVNYWRAKSGKDATKLDWPATWRNWLLRAADDGPSRPAERRPSFWSEAS